MSIESARFLKNKSFVYNNAGYVDINLVFDDSTTDVRIKPGTFVKMTYTDSELLNLVEEKLFIRSLVYESRSFNTVMKKVLVFSVEDYSTKEQFEVLFDSIFNIIVLEVSPLLDGEVLTNNISIVSSASELTDVDLGDLIFVSAPMTAPSGQVLGMGVYELTSEGYIVTTSNSEEINTVLGDYRCLSSIEERDRIAAYEGLIVSIPIIKALNTIQFGISICKGVKFNAVNEITVDETIMSFTDTTKSIIALDGKIYYRNGSTDTLIYDGESFIGVDSDNIYWLGYNLIVQNVGVSNNISLSVVYMDNTTYKYENGSWGLFDPEIQSGSSSGSDTPSTGDVIFTYTTKFNFPTVGDSKILYIDDSTNLLYRWSNLQNKYFIPNYTENVLTKDNVKCICGGSSTELVD